MVNTAVLVSGGGTNLQAILDAYLFGELGECNLAAVITSSPDAYAATRAQSANIPVHVVDRTLFPNKESFFEAISKKLRDLDIELAVLAGFAYEPTIGIIRDFENRIINVRSSLMPAFCEEGLADAELQSAVLARGVKIAGATAYFVSPSIESAPIIMQRAVEVREDDTPATLQQRVLSEAEWVILPKVIALYCSGRLTVEGSRVHIAPEG